jgi:hypothetical protein
MRFPWFKRIGIFFIPVSFTGWTILAVQIGYAIYIFLEIDRKSHSVSDTLMNFIFNMLILG